MLKRRNGKLILRYSMGGIMAFILAIAPVLDPYVFVSLGSAEIMLMDILVLFCVGIMLLKRKTKFPILAKQILFFLFFLALLTLVAFFGAAQNRNMVIAYKNIIVWIVYVILVGITWNGVDKERFLIYVNAIVICATILIIVQFIAGNLGIAFWDGKLPGLQLGKYDGWAGFVDVNTGDVRPNGFFQEPSYFSLYSLPYLMYLVSNKKYKKAMLITGVFLLTTSMVGILGAALVWLISFVSNARKRGDFVKSIITLCAIVVLACVVVSILYSRIEFVRTSLGYILKRLTNINSDLSGTRMSSTKYRLLGQIAYFDNYSMFHKMFGAGAAQFAPFVGLSNGYSNIWVTTILDYGVIGTLALAYLLIAIIIKNSPKRVWKHVVVIAVIFACDRVWFNWYFFYLFTWVYILSNKESKLIEN